ncbi:MAG: LemA family protein [Planctomycetota bacterium]|nr:LemA family protein [Planctomycetota bacterium]
MSPLLIALLVIGGVFLIAIVWTIKVFNTLVRLDKRHENGMSQIEVQLKRRHDLIPNLVETAKGYMSHERETLEAVIAARNQAVSGLKAATGDPKNPEAMKGLGEAEGALGSAMGRLFAVMEAYPDLKANQNMMQLSEELTSTENKVSFSRQAYNDSVTSYNIYKGQFPNIVVASMFGHGRDANLLEFDMEQIAEAPKVSFN